MSLINCPECGKENVSENADACPSCGYGIKNHFEALREEEERKEQEKERNEIYQRNLDNIKMPEKPVYWKGDAITGIIAICFGLLFLILSPVFGIIVLIISTGFFIKRNDEYKIELNKYDRAIMDFDQFKKDEVGNVQDIATPINQVPRSPKCPKCGSSNFDMVKRNWSATTGFMTNKVDRVCRVCKKRF